MNLTDRADFVYKTWMVATAFVVAVMTAFLALAFLSPDVSIQLPRGRSGAVSGD